MGEKDQAITSKVLKLCNSSYYNFSKGVSSVQQAVALLGYTTLYKIDLTAAISDFFEQGVA